MTDARPADSAAPIHVEVLYALARHAELIALELPAGATLEQAIAASGLLEKYPEIQLGQTHKTGIYAKLAALDTVLREHDRVEIYRPLIADPKTARKKRAARQKDDSATQD